MSERETRSEGRASRERRKRRRARVASTRLSLLALSTLPKLPGRSGRRCARRLRPFPYVGCERPPVAMISSIWDRCSTVRCTATHWVRHSCRMSAARWRASATGAAKLPRPRLGQRGRQFGQRSCGRPSASACGQQFAAALLARLQFGGELAPRASPALPAPAWSRCTISSRLVASSDSNSRCAAESRSSSAASSDSQLMSSAMRSRVVRLIEVQLGGSESCRQSFDCAAIAASSRCRSRDRVGGCVARLPWPAVAACCGNCRRNIGSANLRRRWRRSCRSASCWSSCERNISSACPPWKYAGLPTVLRIALSIWPKNVLPTKSR